jgi:phospholipid/cholesterol/gamma-HCH transport system permease protein
MDATPSALSSRVINGSVGWLGHSVLAVVGYVGGVTILAATAAGAILWPIQIRRGRSVTPGFFKTLVHQLFWMLVLGIPLVGLTHVAIGSFLSLQGYYGSTFVDGTGAVVGVGLVRNMGALMTGITFAGLLAARMIPELRILARHIMNHTDRAADETSNRDRRGGAQVPDPDVERTVMIARGRLAAPRILAAGIACVFLALWGITIGTLVGWQASQSLMGVSTDAFFMMMMKMLWVRDVVGLVIKGFIFGAVPATICCYEGLGPGANEDEPDGDCISPSFPAHGVAPPWSTPVFRAACLSLAAILIVNSSWFMLVYHAVPFYGPTLLAPPGL